MVCAQEEAEKEGLVDSHMLNGMLRVHTNSGRIEPAIRYYNTAFEKHGKVCFASRSSVQNRILPAANFPLSGHVETHFSSLKSPTTHSDRLLFEMLVKKKRLERAFKLKQDIESRGRTLDLLSYGTLTEHYGNHNQLGSALMVIRECIDKHGLPPGEKALKKVRIMCRKAGEEEQRRLEELVGKDPLEWKHQGETLKYSRKKRQFSSSVQYGMNRFLDI